MKPVYFDISHLTHCSLLSVRIIVFLTLLYYSFYSGLCDIIFMVISFDLLFVVVEFEINRKSYFNLKLEIPESK